eukprot:130574_1
MRHRRATFTSSSLIVFLSLFIILCSDSTAFPTNYPTIPTCGGNGNGASCAFPFALEGISTWTKCTNFGKERPWCHTADGKWGYCACENTTPAPTLPTTNEPDYYALTRGNTNNGVIKTLFVRFLFPGQEAIQIGTYETLLYPSVAMFFTDSSWGKLTYSFFTIHRNYRTDLTLQSITSLNQMHVEAFRLAELDGYIWCKGICGTPGKLRRNTHHYDQIVVAIHDMSADSSVYAGWSGKANYNLPRVAFHYTEDAENIEHEFGHNLGLNHQYSAKYDRGFPDIGETYDGESRMGGGGYVRSDLESSRFKENGHFGVCAKESFGWLESEHIVTLNADTIQEGTFTLNAFDRPDVVPDDTDTIAATGSNYFALKIEYPSQYEDVSDYYKNYIYISYRTSYAGEESGASIQYCIRFPNDNLSGGAQIKGYTYDVHGDSATQKDHYVYVGESFVIQPLIHSLEGAFANPFLARKNIWKVTVLSVGDGWEDCDAQTNICRVSRPNLSMKVHVQLMDPPDAQNTPVDTEASCTSNNEKQFQINTNLKKYHVIHVQSEELGVHGRGTTDINFCARNAHGVKAFVYDGYPYAVLHGEDLGIGSLMSYTFGGNTAGSTTPQTCSYPDCKISAVQIVQREESYLHIAELEVFAKKNGPNIADQSECYTYPSTGHGGQASHLIDGDDKTFSHSSNAGVGIWDACVFKDGTSIKQIKVRPRDSWWSRSSKLVVKLWSEALMGGTTQLMEFSGLMYSYDIDKDDTAWDGGQEVITLPTELTMTPEECDSSEKITVPFIAGEFYIALEILGDASNDGLVDVTMNMQSCSITSCPVNTYDDGVKCTRCPKNWFASKDSTSIDDCKACPHHRELVSHDQSWCDVAECSTVIVSHANGLGNALDGIYYLSNAQYLSNALTHAISYDTTNTRYQIVDTKTNNVIAYSDATNDIYPFLLETAQWHEEGVVHLDDIPNTKVQAVVVTQRIAQILSLGQIKIFAKSDPEVNIAKTEAKCFNFPINKGVWSYYAGDDHGWAKKLNNDDLSSVTENGPGNSCDTERKPCQMACFLDEAMEIDHIIVYPRNSGGWRWSRSKDVKIDIYESVTFGGLTMEESSASNSLMDNAVFGAVVYSQDHVALTALEGVTIAIEKKTTEENMPIQVMCPNKYALQCENKLDAMCNDNRVARYAGFTYNYHKSDYNYAWRCMEKSSLTDDLLNYKMSHYQTSSIWSSMDTRAVSQMLDDCNNDHIAESVTYECTVNGVANNDMSGAGTVLNGGDQINCVVTLANKNGQNVVSNEVAWSVVIIALRDQTETGMKSKTTVDNNVISTSITIPSSTAVWRMSFFVDQSAIGGKHFALWNKDIAITQAAFEVATEEETDSYSTIGILFGCFAALVVLICVGYCVYKWRMKRGGIRKTKERIADDEDVADAADDVEEGG